jgi:exo-beta-1,3-glucanase (GH17 family)
MDSGVLPPTLEEQLSVLREKFDGLVLYRCDEEADLTVAAAVRLKYRAVFLTVWDPVSKDEITQAAHLVNRYQDQIALGVSIGSEGLMEKRYTLGDIEHAVKSLRDQTHSKEDVEVTTTEPWWFYTRDASETAAVRAIGDFTSANIHVVWDTDIADPARAADWTADRATALRKVITKDLVIREAGFPGAGSSPWPNAHFIYTREMQAAFWMAWQLRSHRSSEHLPLLVAFEGIDNQQKRWQNFEDSWGLLSFDLKPHLAWAAFPVIPPGSSARLAVDAR